MKDGKKILGLTAAAVLGNWVAERYVLQAVPGGTGFVPVKAGMGLDDLARGVTIALVAIGGGMLLRKVG